MAPKQGYDSYGQKIGGSQYIPIPGATGATMSTGMNSYQIAGLIGSTTSNVLSTYNTYMSAQSTAMQLSTQASTTALSGILGSAQILAQSNIQQVMRRAEQEELAFQSAMALRDKDVLAAQADLVKAESNAKATQLYESLNNNISNITATAVAQNRYGATIENIQRREYYKTAQNMELVKAQESMALANVQKQMSSKDYESKMLESSAGASAAYSTYESTTAQITADYTKQSSMITAESLRSQAKYARKMATTGAYIGAAGTLASLGAAIA